MQNQSSNRGLLPSRTPTALARLLSSSRGAYPYGAPHAAPRRSKATAAARLERRSTPPPVAFTHVMGFRAIQAMRPALLKLAEASGQTDSVEDLNYFLQKPGLMRRIPHLILMRNTGESAENQGAHGALLIHEFRPFGLPTGVFATSDRSGRSVLLSLPGSRLRYALRASDLLFRKGARMVLMTVDGESEPDFAGWGRSVRGVEWAFRNRAQPSHLELEATYEATLVKLGQKTRANLRYYRRRAEKELECRFLPEVVVSPQDVHSFNSESSFPLPKRVLSWRLRVQSQLQSPYMVGLKDGQGRWLSLIAGRRFGDSTEILWQLNRSGLERHSMVTAMRSFHMEHEIAQGMKRLYVEGGTNHSLQHSFSTAPATDVVMIRRGLRAGMSGFAKRYVPPDNILAEMLSDPTNDWRSS